MSAPTSVVVSAPPPPTGVDSSWRRVVTGVKPGKGAWALDGPWLSDRRCVVTTGALVIAVDRYPDRYDVALYEVTPDGLVEVKRWDRKSPLGKRQVDFLARRLPAHPVRVTEIPPETNTRASWCVWCRAELPAEAGVRVDLADGGRRWAHPAGECRARPDRVNEDTGRCADCGGQVKPGAGALTDLVRRGQRNRYVLRHAVTPCPDQANEWDSWCVDCGLLVPAGAGVRARESRRDVRHRECPPRPESPFWHLRRRRAPRGYRVGETLRVRLAPRTGEPKVPVDAPGYRVLTDHGLVGVFVTVIETYSGRTYQHARVRIATPDEAAPLLVDEVQWALTAVPDREGCKAVWSAERIGGPRHCPPYLAEITGRRRNGYVLEFQRPKRDYTRSNSTGTRGVRYYWTLAVNRVYQARRAESWAGSDTFYLRATPDGEVRQITREEVEAWLDVASELMYSLPPDNA